MKWLESLFIATVAIFAPIQTALITVFVLTIADLVLGVMAARKQGKPITSSGLKNTVGKIFLYEIALCLAFLVQQYLTGDIFPAAKLISALIGVVELKSILENMDIINGSSIFKTIITKLLQKQESDLGDK